MGKLYYFGIGGTGSRVLKSLLVLLSAGVRLPNTSEVVPIIIDPDKGAADLARTSDFIREYQQLNAYAKGVTADSSSAVQPTFFATPVNPPRSGLVLPLLAQSNKRFDESIGYATMSKEQKAITQLLFSGDVRKMSMEVGFKGNPNMGSIVLNQFDESEEFKAFLQDFQPGDRIFIVGSIFGGTGASGFPLLVKTLRNLDALPGTLANAAVIKEAMIGATTIFPYFAVEQNDESAIDSSTFYSKTTAALSYYEHNMRELNHLYYVGDARTKALPNVEGGAQQQNPAHFVELASALAIYDFVSSPEYRGYGETVYKEYGLKNPVDDNVPLDFRHLSDKDRADIAPKLTQLLLFFNYLHFHLAKAESQPWHKDLGNVFSGNFKRSQLDAIASLYYSWLQEVGSNARAFIPFKAANESRPFDIVTGYEEKRGGFLSKKDYALFNEKLNKASQACKASSPEAKVLEIFFKATQDIVNDKFKF